jgi:hypothetical protein
MSSGVLLDNGDIPRTILLNSDITQHLSDLVSQYLDLIPSWVKFNLVDVLDEDYDIVLVYAAMVPSQILTKQGQWISPGELNDSKIKKLVFKAAQKIAGGI